MNTYVIWCDLKDPREDLAFADAVKRYLGFLKNGGLIEGYRMQRRKLGFGPENLGEFQIILDLKDLAQLEAVFSAVASRTGELESLHAAVYSRVTNFKAGLYRDFPDPERLAAAE